MAQKSIGIIMNGVSGRMGYRQHLVRSILAIREQGGVVLRRRLTACRCEPILVGRSEAKLAELAAKHGIERLHHRPRRRARRPALGDLRRLPRHEGACRGDPQGDRGGQGHLHREAHRRERRRGARARRASPRRPASRTASCTTSSTCPGLQKLQAPDRLRLLRPHPRRCAASSATGSSRATGSPPSGRAGTTAPRTAAASSSTCSRTGTTCSRTSSAGSSRSTRGPSPTSPTRVDEKGAALRRDRRRRRLRRSSSSRAA